MTPSKEQRRKPETRNPYLAGNFAPLRQTQPLTPCTFTGHIPGELYGGEYVRNGGNPVTNEDLGRDAHWFDGDGMLSGVAFRRIDKGGVQPEFVNQYVLTDLYISTVASSFLRIPILPSIATLVNPLSSLYKIILRVFRTVALVILSRLPGSAQAIERISVANTGILYHDGRALATCESGPPMRVSLPRLETVGWFNGKGVEGEPGGQSGAGFGGKGILSFMREWTTAHPRVDPRTRELILFHSSFAAPFVYYSIIPASHPPSVPKSPLEPPIRLLNAPVPGVSSAKMMHDFGVSPTHTVILDLPLSLDPLNLARNKPVVSYDPEGRSRFGVFPRYNSSQVRWFETSACCIFHTANTWDEYAADSQKPVAVNMLACRLTSASLIFSAGGLTTPTPIRSITSQEDEQCRLYYYQFSLSPFKTNTITHQFALSAIPFEFPTVRNSVSMSAARYIYGCSVSTSTFSAALGRSVKIDCLVKIDAVTLIYRGIANPPESLTGCVDTRAVHEILASSSTTITTTTTTDTPDGPIKIFKLPLGCYAQEPRFVPRDGSSEDDGWLLTYVFDESQLDERGECPPSATSELWIIDARNMRDVVGRVHLPQRVPYGLHGSWFSEEEVLGQRPVETIRSLPKRTGQEQFEKTLLGKVRKRIGWVLG